LILPFSLSLSLSQSLLCHDLSLSVLSISRSLTLLLSLSASLGLKRVKEEQERRRMEKKEEKEEACDFQRYEGAFWRGTMLSFITVRVMSAGAGEQVGGFIINRVEDERDGEYCVGLL
jgi:thymidylate kinase